MDIYRATPECELFCQFGALDPTIQGALIGAMTALLAAFLTAGISALITFFQLRSQRKERQKDRALEIKKDVLMGVLDGIAESRTALTRIANFDTPLSKIQEEFNAGNRTAQRAHGVASVPIVEALQAYNEASARLFMGMMFKRIELDALKAKADFAQNRMDGYQRVSSSLVERHQEQMLGGPTTQENLELSRRMLALSKQNSERADEALSEFQELSGHLTQVIDDVARSGVDSQLKLHPYVQKITQLIRAEIGVDSEPSIEYLRASSIEPGHVTAVLDDAINSALEPNDSSERRI